MPETITLPAMKRIEGHGRIALQLDDGDAVAGAHFEVVEFRGFEKMLEGRMVWEMPLITSRICGVCPVSHHLASVRAVDALYGVEIPRAASLARELLHLGGFAQDHALHFFFLAGPDHLVSDGAGSRDLLGVIASRPELARDAIALRRAGQRIAEIVGGRTSHPVAAIPGGMSKAITPEQRAEMRELATGMLVPAIRAATLAAESTERLLAEHPDYSAHPVHYLAQTHGEVFALYDGTVRVMEPDGSEGPVFDTARYAEFITEQPQEQSYANIPRLSYPGAGDGEYRVGPLARVNIVDSMPGPESQRLLDEFRARHGRPVHEVLVYHHARMIELVAAVERMITILDDDEIISSDVRVKVERGIAGTGIAAVEAPRGTLIHHYEADELGKVTKANLVVATTHNVGSIDRAVLEAVEGVSRDAALSDDAVRQMELGIRAHDPCLSCATHEIGRMPLVVVAYDTDGSIVAERGVQ